MNNKHPLVITSSSFLPTVVATVAFLLCHTIRPSLAFVVPCKGRPWFNIVKGYAKGGGLGNGNLPPPPRKPNSLWGCCNFDDDADDDALDELALAAPSLLVAMIDETLLSDDYDEEQLMLLQDEKENGEENTSMQPNHPEENVNSTVIRGGSTSTQSSNPTKDILAGTKSSIQTTVTYWSDAFQQLQERIVNILPINTKRKTDKELDLTKIPIQDVQAPTSDILPDVVVKRAAQRSGMLGSVMTADRVNECARQLKQWYLQRGYVLHSVTGATLHAENGTATLAVQEPILSSTPMDIRFAKEVPIDPDTGETTTRKKYREKLERIKGRPLRSEEWIAVVDKLNTTLIESKGRTSASTLSKRLGLKAGHHFCWDGDRWQSIARSGIFTKIWRTSPVQMGDGTVQLQVLCQESPPRNLEYGISKSLYTGNWEGELDFKHGNFFGGGESLGLIVRRGARDPEPSVTLRYSDDKFGMQGGYDAEVFSEYIAVDDPSKYVSAKGSTTMPEPSQSTSEHQLDAQAVADVEDISPPPLSNIPVVEENDSLLCRQGFKFSLRGPIPSNIVSRSSASTAIERTSTRKGIHESIGSATLNLGPFVRDLPLGARSSIATSTTSGVRLGGKRLLPFSSGSVTSRQLFPLFTNIAVTSNRQIKLALQHSVMSATSHLPRHEANAAGFAARVRGISGSSVGPIDLSVVGSAEIRVPVTIPIQKDKIVQDGSVVLFGDWMFAHRQTDSSQNGFSMENTFGKSSIGIGLRKSVQGIPLKYDLSLTRDGKVGAFVSLGSDWEIY